MKKMKSNPKNKVAIFEVRRTYKKDQTNATKPKGRLHRDWSMDRRSDRWNPRIERGDLLDPHFTCYSPLLSFLFPTSFNCQRSLPLPSGSPCHSLFLSSFNRKNGDFSRSLDFLLFRICYDKTSTNYQELLLPKSTWPSFELDIISEEKKKIITFIFFLYPSTFR